MESTKTGADSKNNINTVKDHDFKIPKNLRQIGNISGLSKVIYVEDYVMSFIKQLSEREQNESKIAILLGKDVGNEGGNNIFINGAVEMSNIDINESNTFTDESWTDVYVKIKEYFSNVEIVGWALIGLGLVIESNSKLNDLHKENFKGSDKVVLKYDSMEKEESFYIIEDNQFIKQKGYYIYYEKNVEMQNYMIDYNSKNKEKVQEDYEDVATKKIRTVIEEKNNKKVEKSTARLTYAAGTLLAVIILMVATTMLRNYHQMKNLETALHSLTENIKMSESEVDNKQVQNNTDVVDNQTESPSETSVEQPSKAGNGQENSDDAVDVETVPGKVSQTEEPTSGNQEETIEDEPEQTAPSQTDQTNEETEEVVSVVNEVKYYIVRPGDSLASICSALYNNASQEKIDELLELNDIEDQDKIYAGQQLIVP